MNNLIVSYQLNQSADQFLWGLKEGRSRAAALRNKVIICPDKSRCSHQYLEHQLCNNLLPLRIV